MSQQEFQFNAKTLILRHKVYTNIFGVGRPLSKRPRQLTNIG